MKAGPSESLFAKVRAILDAARHAAARSVNTTQVVAYWLVGREIVVAEQQGRQRAEYGKRMVETLSRRMTKAIGPGYSPQNLFYMRQFYSVYDGLLGAPGILHAARGKSPGKDTRDPSRILHAVRGESGGSALREIGKAAGSRPAAAWKPGRLHPDLSWTHYRLLLKVEKIEARSFYEIEAIKNKWASRELERQINSLLYERLALSKDKRGLLRLAAKGQEIRRPGDAFKDPVVIEFLGLPESPRLVETGLEQALIDNLRAFLLELGRGFAFVSRQERITVDGDHFYIDLVFYHTVLKCFVLIELKTGKLTHQDLGQLQFYVNYFDRERRSDGDQPTLGLILCADKNEAVVRYTLGADRARRIFASRYRLHLPSEALLKAQIKRELKELRR